MEKIYTVTRASESVDPPTQDCILVKNGGNPFFGEFTEWIVIIKDLNDLARFIEECGGKIVIENDNKITVYDGCMD